MSIGLLLAFTGGCIAVFSKMINLKLVERLGLLNGTLVNYIVATFVSILAIFLSKNYHLLNLNVLNGIPLWVYLGGVFGLMALLLNIITLPTLPVIYSTILILIGQLGAGLVIDILFKGKFSTLKLVGITLVILGIGIDKMITKHTEIKIPISSN